MTQSITARKAALRAWALRRRMGVDDAQARRFAEILPERAAKILPKNKALAKREGAAALYSPVRGEPDCSLLLAALHASGWRILLPCVLSRQPSALLFRAHEPGGGLVAGLLGAIPEPPASQPAARPDIAFVPCAAFDRRGGRIGFGGGFYDVTLRALRADGHVVAIGVAYAVQEVDAAPVEPHDQLLDFVLTESETINCAGSRKIVDANSLHR